MQVLDRERAGRVAKERCGIKKEINGMMVRAVIFRLAGT